MEPAMVTIPNVELVSTGEDWKASTGNVTFTEQDLQNILASQDAPDVKEPRLILGHTPGNFPASVDEGFFGEQPTIGKFTNLRLSDNNQTLVGDLVGVPKWLADILPTAYPNRSVEVYWNQPSAIPNAKPHAAVMPRIALLGVNLPAVATLEDLQVLFSEEGPDGVELVKAGERVVASRGDIMPNRVAASVQYEDVRRDFYNNFATEESGRYWWWIKAVYVDPPLLVVDDDEESLWAVTYSVKGDTTEFGDPVKIKVQYVEEDSGKVAAQAADGSGRQYTKADSRPSNRPKEKTAMGLNIAALRSRTGLTPEQLPDDASEEQINAALGLEPEGEPDPGVQAEQDNPKPEGEPEPESEPERQPATTAAASGVTVDKEAWEQTQATIQRLQGDLEQRTTKEREGAVEAAIKAGKIPPSRREHYVKLMQTDPDGTAEFLEGLEPTIPVDQREIGVGDDSEASKAATSDYDLSWLQPHERARVEAARAGKDLPTPRLVLEG